MIKRGKNIIIGLSSLVAVAATSKIVSFPDEKLTTSALKNGPDDKAFARKAKLKTDTLNKHPQVANHKLDPERRHLVDQIIRNGLSRIGTPYLYGGTTESGFDCSGFVHYAFQKFNINIPRSSKEMAEIGKPVKLRETRKGDILIFTGTNVSDRTPGHVGIVISKAGEAIQFVHSSSNGGVKISQVDGTNYERRFLETRRVL